MRTLLVYTREYFHDQWYPRYWLALTGFLAVSFFANYAFALETTIIRRLPDPGGQFAFFLVFFSIPYFAATTAYGWVRGDRGFFSEWRFWFLSVFCIVVLAAYITLHNVPGYLLRNHVSVFSAISPSLRQYSTRYASNILPGVGIFLPIAAYWYAVDRKDMNLYGLSTKNIRLRSYFLLLLMLIPIVVAASFGGDFQSAYPRFKFGLPVGGSGLHHLSLVGGFEMCFGVDFVFVEFFFRGFMVLALSRYLGKGSVFPMVIVYAFIHFQKPLGEALGSIVGGTVLGILSLRTQSIYGGVILHLGIAYCMELAGTLQMLRPGG